MSRKKILARKAIWSAMKFTAEKAGIFRVLTPKRSYEEAVQAIGPQNAKMAMRYKNAFAGGR